MSRHEKLVQSLLATPAFVDPINSFCVEQLARIEKECKDKFNMWLSDVVLQEVVTTRKHNEELTHKEHNKNRENMRELVKHTVARELKEQLDHIHSTMKNYNLIMQTYHLELTALQESMDLLTKDVMQIQCTPWQRFKRWLQGA